MYHKKLLSKTHNIARRLTKQPIGERSRIYECFTRTEKTLSEWQEVRKNKQLKVDVLRYTSIMIRKDNEYTKNYLTIGKPTSGNLHPVVNLAFQICSFYARTCGLQFSRQPSACHFREPPYGSIGRQQAFINSCTAMSHNAHLLNATARLHPIRAAARSAYIKPYCWPNRGPHMRSYQRRSLGKTTGPCLAGR